MSQINTQNFWPSLTVRIALKSSRLAWNDVQTSATTEPKIVCLQTYHTEALVHINKWPEPNQTTKSLKLRTNIKIVSKDIILIKQMKSHLGAERAVSYCWAEPHYLTIWLQRAGNIFKSRGAFLLKLKEVHHWERRE